MCIHSTLASFWSGEVISFGKVGISGLSSGSQVQVSLSLMVELVSDFALIQSILPSDLSGYVNSVDWNGGMERWSGLLEWSTGLDYWSATPTNAQFA